MGGNTQNTRSTFALLLTYKLFWFCVTAAHFPGKTK